MIKRLKFEKYLHRPNAPTEEITGLPLAVKWESSQKPMVQHSHRFTELVIVLSGYGIHQGNGFRSEISRGDILVIPLGCTHNYQECQQLSLVNIIFDFDRLPIPFMDMHLLPGFHELFPESGEFFRTPRPCPWLRLTEDQLTNLEPQLNELHMEYKNFTPGRDFRMLSLFMVITGKIVSAYPLSSSLNGNELFPTYQLSTVLGFLNREFSNPITLQDILRRIPMSRSTLNRNFIKAFGMSPMRYLNKLRLDHAAKLLNSSNLSISEVARQSGFEDSNYFSRIFHKNFGTPPGKWRKIKH